jgi:nucleotide-binding universal stress UspA family protein
MFNKVLLAYDGSGGSKNALDKTIELVLKFNSELYILSVGIKANTLIRYGKPCKVIVDVAEELKVDLIISRKHSKINLLKSFIY